MNVHVSTEAAEHIRGRGGRLFLWSTPVGRAFVRDHLAFAPPAEPVEFACRSRRGVDVCVAQDVGAREVLVRTPRRPLRGLRVHVDGKRWGWRGGAAGSG
ncbi:MAG: hypothetical protein ICV64_03475 [Thermoleophilia bacterium]|nr:hypothetical protein [Thermoleophilia bacterium]